MAKYNYVKLEDSIARVYELVSPERISEKTLYKWASDAVKDVYAIESMVERVCFSRVENYKAKLPGDWKKLQQILYNVAAIDTDNPIEIYLFTGNLVQDTVAETNDAFTTTIREATDEDDLPTSTTDLFQSRNPLLGQPQGTYIQGHFYKFTPERDLQMFEHIWAPLRESTSNFHQAINCGIDLTTECSGHTYSYDREHQCITTSFERGWVCISYRAYPKCDANFLIPDRESKVPQAIEKYLLYKVFEKETIKGVEGAASLQRKYQQEWELMCAAAKGEQKMPDIDELENLKNMLVRLTQHNNTYKSGFGNMSHLENMILR